MDAKPDHNAAPKVVNGRINGRFAPGGTKEPQSTSSELTKIS